MKPFVHLFPFLIFALLTACAEDGTLPAEDLTPSTTFLVDHNEDGHVAMPELGLQQPIQQHVDGHSAHFGSATPITNRRPDGTVETLYLVDDDIALTKDQLRELRAMDAALEKQYRTNNLVTDNYITVEGYTGSGYALTSKMQTALQWAVANYNALNTDKQFVLTFGATTNADIVVYRDVSNNGAGGQAGFPSGGQPYKWVVIYNGMENYDTNVNEHVMTHEIGHSMGLRHTDWFSRESCGQTGESAGSTGAVHIPGTPTGFDANSVMLSCFSSGEDGEFGYYDRVALEYLY
ncbi:hypothetical protein GGR26_001182 [Lewinella marina]|uniref:Peptidase n=1 Tax=Neolewinella marina TaxID=438751 RepID=A0A2G0CFX4_9BACT|nr:M57 family metalloprotease [Neolewinella marina]NJB85437.1 hypothetical protein [Neolewinella marina]PHK98871.1 peptidase [Neolewinella marina]